MLFKKKRIAAATVVLALSGLLFLLFFDRDDDESVAERIDHISRMSGIANIEWPPAPDFKRKVDYVSWYQTQVDQAVRDDSLFLLSDEPNYEWLRLLRPFLEDIDSMESSGFVRADHAESFAAFDEIVASAQRITVAEKYASLAEADYEHLWDGVMPDMQNDRILASALVVLAIELPVDEQRFLAYMEEALKIARYGQYGNLTSVEKNSSMRIQKHIWGAAFFVLKADKLSGPAIESLYELLVKYESKCPVRDLSQSVVTSLAGSYSLQQHLTDRRWYNFRRPRLSVRKLQKFFEGFHHLHEIQGFERTLLFWRIARQSPQNLARKTANAHIEILEYLLSDEHANPHEFFDELTEKYSQNKYMKYCTSPVPGFRHLLQQAALLNMRKSSVFLILEIMLEGENEGVNLSDAIICLESTHCPERCAVHSTNKKHFRPLCELLGIESHP